ncbi:trypsin-like peptidase domain-containing protein [Spirulina subsalsa FACHB-351]|uniref:Trypsin-like peptidase domain-containing protein n=1 Tax=Spirulina subsalsa FACHB-351 TaxID=234711 RepID=A0ABT3LAT7_9CYAN|nr:trypsin-like peptidase domain-containing protein [Spirulina subsalsa]MCW6038624.1 trypsin-like peptidase domain-containing protein [Spirulina subsalsa FACHB-351]
MKPAYLFACALSCCLVAAPPVGKESSWAALSFAQPSFAATPKFNPTEQTRIQVYEKASPAVVTIDTGNGSGSGSIIQEQGLVLTNHHVVSGARQGVVLVITADGQRHRGQVLALDRRNDLALVQIIADRRFPTIPLATSREIRVGQEVYAIGSPFGLAGTFTTGILSRIAPNGDLQTDAAINQGNSGGPLLNSQGHLIGVNKAILSTGGGNIGIGFATSAEAAQGFINQHRDRIAQARNAALELARQPQRQPQARPPAPSRDSRHSLGIAITSDLVIQQVQQGSLAARLGLRPGDRIVAINRRRVYDIRDLLSFLNSRPGGAEITFARDRRLATVQIRF